MKIKKILQNSKNRKVVNITLFIVSILYFSVLVYELGVSATSHSTDISLWSFLETEWGNVFKLLVLILLSHFYSNSKTYQNYPIYNFTGGHLFAQILAISAILTGSYVSIMSTKINYAIQCHLTNKFCGTENSDFKFLSIAIILIVLFYIFHGKHSVSLKRAREEYENNQSEKLRLAIQVAPPPYFAKKLADYSDIVEDLFQEMSEDYTSLVNATSFTTEHQKTLESQQVVLRCSLMALARLAQAYDNVDPSQQTAVKYRANLMLCLKSDNDDVIPYFEKSHPIECMRFALPFEAKPYFKLFIDSRYSINVDQNNDDLNNANLFTIENEGVIQPTKFEIDNTVDNAMMPVYWDETHDVINYNVIGAPKSIVKGDAQFISDTVEEAKAANYYSEDIQQSVLKYFAADTKGRSIVSLPVATRHYKLGNGYKEDIDRFLGVINIYRNTRNIFAGKEENFEFFADFTRPLRLVIARMAYTHIDSIALVEQLKEDTTGPEDKI